MQPSKNAEPSESFVCRCVCLCGSICFAESSRSFVRGSGPNSAMADASASAPPIPLVIIGAGPCSLAVLLRLAREAGPLSCMPASSPSKARARALFSQAVIVDCSGGWLTLWRRKLGSQGVEHLRSPTFVHPHASRVLDDALYSFASKRNQQGDLLPLPHGTPNNASRMWHAPSRQLFDDFCARALAEVHALDDSLGQRLIHARVTDIQPTEDGSLRLTVLRLAPSSSSALDATTPEEWLASRVVLAVGDGGYINWPNWTDKARNTLARSAAASFEPSAATALLGDRLLHASQIAERHTAGPVFKPQVPAKVSKQVSDAGSGVAHENDNTRGDACDHLDGSSNISGSGSMRKTTTSMRGVWATTSQWLSSLLVLLAAEKSAALATAAWMRGCTAAAAMVEAGRLRLASHLVGRPWSSVAFKWAAQLRQQRASMQPKPLFGSDPAASPPSPPGSTPTTGSMELGTSVCSKGRGRLVVVGGGLSAAQLAIEALHQGWSRVILLVRGRHVLRPFDIDIEWMGRHLSLDVHGGEQRFFGAPLPERRAELRRARPGGSIPRACHEHLTELQRRGGLVVLEEACVLDAAWHGPAVGGEWRVHVIRGRGADTTAPERAPPSAPATTTSMPPPAEQPCKDRAAAADQPAEALCADAIWLATGHDLDVRHVAALGSTRRLRPQPEHGGLPQLTPALRWDAETPLYVAGALAALQLGPDAFNLAGCGLCASRIVSDLLEHDDCCL